MEQTLTAPPPSSSSVLRGGELTVQHQSILRGLCAVHSIKPYATLPYFRRIFAMGMHNLEERQQAQC